MGRRKIGSIRLSVSPSYLMILCFVACASCCLHFVVHHGFCALHCGCGRSHHAGCGFMEAMCMREGASSSLCVILCMLCDIPCKLYVVLSVWHRPSMQHCARCKLNRAAHFIAYVTRCIVPTERVCTGYVSTFNLGTFAFRCAGRIILACLLQVASLRYTIGECHAINRVCLRRQGPSHARELHAEGTEAIRSSAPRRLRRCQLYLTHSSLQRMQ